MTCPGGEGDDGPGRKFFAVTPAGRIAMQDRTSSWLTFTERAAALAHVKETDRMRARVRTYGQDLLVALRMRDVPGPRIAEVLAEVDSHVRETGEDPRETFGAPKRYAAEVSAALGDPVKPSWRHVFGWRTSVVTGLTMAAGAWFLLNGVTARSTDEPGVLGLPPTVLILLGTALLLALAAELLWFGRRPGPKVVDPRSGGDMTPSVPRWLLPVLVVGAPGVPLVLAAVLTITQR